jgi:methylmalonyl-CoA mutase
MTDSKKTLFSEFPPISTEAWMEKIVEDLKGADFEKKLVWKTYEGFPVRPFYREEDLKAIPTVSSYPGEFPYVRGTRVRNRWLIRQEIDVKDIASAHAKATYLIQRGVDSLYFILSGGCQLTPSGLEQLLDGINPQAIEINLNGCRKEVVQLTSQLATWLKKQPVDLNQVHASVYYDPYASLLTKGILPDSSIGDTIRSLWLLVADIPGSDLSVSILICSPMPVLIVHKNWVMRWPGGPICWIRPLKPD